MAPGRALRVVRDPLDRMTKDTAASRLTPETVAAKTVMMITVAAIIVPYLYSELRPRHD